MENGKWHTETLIKFGIALEWQLEIEKKSNWWLKVLWNDDYNVNSWQSEVKVRKFHLCKFIVFTLTILGIKRTMKMRKVLEYKWKENIFAAFWKWKVNGCSWKRLFLVFCFNFENIFVCWCVFLCCEGKNGWEYGRCKLALLIHSHTFIFNMRNYV